MYQNYQGGGRPDSGTGRRPDPNGDETLDEEFNEDIVATLDLVGMAKAGALRLLELHPAVQFTSGRRGVEGQAKAMAKNVASDRRWIERTYRPSSQRLQLQEWVDAHPEAKSKADLQAGFFAIMLAWPDEVKGRFSKHFIGLAFDVKPLPAGEQAEAVKRSIRGLSCLEKFLQKEGDQVVWHAQFDC